MQQFYFEELQPAVEKMQEHILQECICTLTRGDEIEYRHHPLHNVRTPGYILSVVYPSGEKALEDEWKGWTVGSPSKTVACERGKLKWLENNELHKLRKANEQILYVFVTDDEYELTIDVDENIANLSLRTGYSISHIENEIWRAESGMKSRFRKVVYDN